MKIPPSLPDTRPSRPTRRIYQRRTADYVAIRYERFTHPAIQDPMRVVLVSDVHARDDWFDGKCVRDLMSVVRSVPDVSAILHLGDFVGDDPTAIDWAAPLLAEIDVPSFAVLGNHDHWSDPERVAGGLAGAGITMLTNRSLTRGDIVLAGVDSCWGGSPDIRASLKGVDNDFPVIVLGHEPWLATLHDRWLHVAGHTHHGQVRAPFFGDKVMNRSMPKKSLPFPKGRYQRTAATASSPATWAYTTAGVGYSTADFRFLCPPEIVVLDLG